MNLRQMIDDAVFGSLKTRTAGVEIKLPLYDLILLWMGTSTLVSMAEEKGKQEMKDDTQFQELIALNKRLKVEISNGLKLAMVETKRAN